jgi:hypothetical protein
MGEEAVRVQLSVVSFQPTGKRFIFRLFILIGGKEKMLISDRISSNTPSRKNYLPKA